MSDGNGYNRRRVLQLATGLTAGVAAGVVGTATADDARTGSLGEMDTSDCDCYDQYDCEGSCWKAGDMPSLSKRRCCDCDDGITCESWSPTGECCF